MAVAINWFEVLLSTNKLSIPMQSFRCGRGGMPARVRIAHRTIQRRQDANTVRVLHLTDDPPPGTSVEPFDADDDPSLAKAAIEAGFTGLLHSKDFLVYPHRVGGSAYFPTELSAHRDVYTFYRGLEYRCFFGFGGRSHRWGLVLNYATSQRFCVSLADQTMQRLAIGQRVVPIVGVELSDDTGAPIKSGTLREVNGGHGIIARPMGDDENIDLRQWTLQCRKEVLGDYLHLARGERASDQAKQQLARDAYLVSGRGFMNTSLAVDQMREVCETIGQFSLTRFNLPLPNQSTASLVDRFLSVGAPT
ncbi:MAG: hypothetical protein ABSH20_08250 [Tepidisphaeraceae bacterium]|jgi:hypothetical protein